MLQIHERFSIESEPTQPRVDNGPVRWLKRIGTVAVGAILATGMIPAVQQAAENIGTIVDIMDGNYDPPALNDPTMNNNYDRTGTHNHGEPWQPVGSRDGVIPQ